MQKCAGRRVSQHTSESPHRQVWTKGGSLFESRPPPPPLPPPPDPPKLSNLSFSNLRIGRKAVFFGLLRVIFSSQCVYGLWSNFSEFLGESKMGEEPKKKNLTPDPASGSELG